MRTTISSVFCLALGAAIGWYVEHTHQEHLLTEGLAQGLQAIERGEAVEAARAVRAVTLIQSGENDKAVRFLSTPIAHYYYIYSTTALDDRRGSELRVLIEELVKTNEIVADEMNRYKTNYISSK
jgi:hypothetical protein